MPCNKQLKFYDVKAKKSFKSSSYKIVKKKVRGKTRRFAVANSPHSDISGWRILKN